MARRLRFFQENGFYFVTARTFQERLLLRADSRIAEVIGGVLARSSQLYGVEIYGFVALSNHVHLLCRARDGSLSRFMQHFLGNTARKVGPLVGWRGRIWHRRYAFEPVLDDGAMEGRLRYILSHGPKEGLVGSPRDWPGLSCIPQLLGNAIRTFSFFHWSRRWKSGSLLEGATDLFSPELEEQIPLELKPLPHWSELPAEQRRRKIEAMLSDIEHKHRATPKVGLEQVTSQDPESRPLRSKRSPQPWCHASTRALAEALRESYRTFAAAFKSASRRFRDGELTAEFPHLAFRPPLQWRASPGAHDIVTMACA